MEWTPDSCYLQLAFNLNLTEFTGVCRWNGSVSQSTENDGKTLLKKLLFDVDGSLCVLNASSCCGNKRKQVECKVYPIDKTRIAVIPSEGLVTGKACLDFKFTGKVREDGLGVFKCNARKEKTVPKKTKKNVKGVVCCVENSKNQSGIVITQFEPCFASLCFPFPVGKEILSYRDYHISIRCSYMLSIAIPHPMWNYEVVSCMQMKNTEIMKVPFMKDETMYKMYTFEATACIPVYILAFAIGEFSEKTCKYTTNEKSAREQHTNNNSSGLLDNKEETILVRILIPGDCFEKKFSEQILIAAKGAVLQSLSAVENFFHFPLVNILPKYVLNSRIM